MGAHHHRPVPVPVHLGDLLGPEGNAFVVLGRVRESFVALDRMGEWPEFEAQAKAGTYGNLLEAVHQWCDDLDGSIAVWREVQAQSDANR